MDKFQQVVAKVDGYIAQYPSVTQYGEWEKFGVSARKIQGTIMFKCVFMFKFEFAEGILWIIWLIDWYVQSKSKSNLESMESVRNRHIHNTV